MGEADVRTAIAEQLVLGSTLLLAVTCVWVVIQFDMPLLGDSRTFFMLMFFPLFQGLQVAFRNELSRQLAIDLLISIAVVFAIFAIRPQLRDLAVIGVLGGVTALYSLLFGVISPDHAYFADAYGQLGTATKAIFGSNLLAGPFGHSNTLGIFSALSLPLMLGLSRRWLRRFLVLAAIFATIWSSSRSALLAAAASLLIYALVSDRRVGLNQMKARVGLVAVGSTVALVPFLTHDPYAYTSRGRIWIGSIQNWSEHVIFGSGPNWYVNVGLQSLDLGAGATSGHNLLISWLATGGLGLAVAGTLVVVLCARVAIDHAARSGDRFVFAYVVALLAVSVFESVWTFNVGADVFLVNGFVIAWILLSSDVTEAQR